MSFAKLSMHVRSKACFALFAFGLTVVFIYHHLFFIGADSPKSFVGPPLDVFRRKALTIDSLDNFFSRFSRVRERPFRDGFSQYEFNETASNSIGVYRSLPDTRNLQCRTLSYKNDDLPTFTVIITYYNEASSTLLRTIASVVQKTRPELLDEIILIDDCSDSDLLGQQLSRLEKLSVVRNLKREGLIRSRIIGAKRSKSDVLVFLDSHSECNVNWIEPLLRRLVTEPKAIVSPVIDIIDADNFQYIETAESLKGGFDWDLSFKWESLGERESNARKLNPVANIKTPTIAGGIFAVRRQWFFDAGSYDEQMDVWGAENIELSLRNWLCGGIIEIAPCSRVGHVFRDAHPYKFDGGKSKVIQKNTRRVADVWLADYVNFFFDSRPETLAIDPGDISSRSAIQRKLKCASFDWYHKNVYPELKLPIRQPGIFYVRIMNNKYCLGYDRRARNWTFKFKSCSDRYTRQLWKLNNRNSSLSIPENFCLTMTKENIAKITAANSDKDCSDQWEIDDQHVKFKKNGLCLSGDFQNFKIEFLNCSQIDSSNKVSVVEFAFG